MPSFLHEIVVSWLNAVLRRWVRRRSGQVAGSETKLAVGPRRGAQWRKDLSEKGYVNALAARAVESRRA